MNHRDRELLVRWLNFAVAEHIVSARKVFVLDEQTMCPLAALYKEATGEVPYRFNDMDDPDIMYALRQATGIDFDLPFREFHNLYMFFVRSNDTFRLGFTQIRDLILVEALS
jgi:hypothetical protein